VTQSQSESLIQRQQVIHSESTIDRERHPDGTVIEREVNRSQTQVVEVELKRETQVAYERFVERKIAEHHQWTQTITSTQGWQALVGGLQTKHSPFMRRLETGVYRFVDEPFDACLNKHEDQMKALVAEFKAAKPKEVTLASKTKWLQFACTKVSEMYPESASAFKRCFIVYNGAKTIKDLDERAQEKYKQLQAANELPIINVKVARLPTTGRGVLTRSNPGCLQLPVGPPLPRTLATEEELLDISNAFDLYYSFEGILKGKNPGFGPHHREEMPKMYSFVEEFLNGNYSRLYSYMMSMQITLRLTKGHALDQSLFLNTQIQSDSGIRNEYIDMQGLELNLFFHPDRDIITSWPRVVTEYKGRGVCELILPDYVAMKMWESPVFVWHRKIFCPAIADLVVLQADWNESEFLHLDGRDYPMSVLHGAPEFAQVLHLHQRRMTELEQRWTEVAPVEAADAQFHKQIQEFKQLRSF